MEIKENDEPKEIEDEGIAKEETHLVEAATLPMMNITQICQLGRSSSLS